MNNYLFEHVKVRSRSELIKRAKQNVFVKHSVTLTLLSRYKQSHPATTERDKHRHTKQRARERERERESFFFLFIIFFRERISFSWPANVKKSGFIF